MSKLASPVEMKLASRAEAVFPHEPVLYAVAIRNRGIPSVSFFHSTELAAMSSDYPLQFRTDPSVVGGDSPFVHFEDGASLKYLEIRTLTFNSVRDFRLEAEKPGEMEIPLWGKFFDYLDGRGIAESLKFTVKVLPLPVEKLRMAAEWKSPADGGGTLSVEWIEEAGKTKPLHLLIERKADAVTRVLRLGERETTGTWTLTMDPVSRRAHALWDAPAGGQTHWSTEPGLTGLEPSESFPKETRKTLQTAPDGAVTVEDAK